jgi:hypothetical protein
MQYHVVAAKIGEDMRAHASPEVTSSHLSSFVALVFKHHIQSIQLLIHPCHRKSHTSTTPETPRESYFEVRAHEALEARVCNVKIIVAYHVVEKASLHVRGIPLMGVTHWRRPIIYLRL